ncbi:hypothetical protein ACM66B_005989 [Microbotryomycetes sp. NB124-2]
MKTTDDDVLTTSTGDQTDSETIDQRMSCEEARSLLSSSESGGTKSLNSNTWTARQAKRALRGFYSYSVASEIYVIVAATLFLPVLLETYARENGRLAPDFVEPCPSSTATEPSPDEQRCSVRIAGLHIDTASFSLYTYSASVFIQALTVISMGSLADNPRIRHQLLVSFAFAGSLAIMAFVVVSPQSSLWGLCVVIAVVANVSFGASIVCLNSYLPALGRSDPAVVELQSAMQAARTRLKTVRALNGTASSGDALLFASQAAARATDEYDTAKALATSHISARAIAAGYASGISALILMLVPIIVSKGSTWSLRLAIAGSGLLWAGGTIPAMLYLKPSSDLIEDLDESVWQRSFADSVKNGWSGLFSMLREWRRLPMTFVYLSGWFLLSDAFATVTSTAILFAKTTLAMSTSSLVLIAILTPMSGIVGAVFFPRLQRETLQWSNLKMVMLLVAFATVVPLWGIIALRTRWQIYLLSIVFGVVFGAFQAFSRTCFSELVPSSQSARWFGLYSITDKSSSFVGPLLVAAITNATGEIRHGFWLILTMLLLSLPILAQVKMERGRQDAEQFDRSRGGNSSTSSDGN